MVGDSQKIFNLDTFIPNFHQKAKNSSGYAFQAICNKSMLICILCGLFAPNVVSFANNVVLRPPLFAANVVSLIGLFAVWSVYVCSSLQLTKGLDRKMDESRRLSGSNFLRAIDIVDQFKCKQVYIYAMGQEPWLNHIMALNYADDSIQITESNKLVEECQKRGILSERLFGKKERLL